MARVMNNHIYLLSVIFDGNVLEPVHGGSFKGVGPLEGEVRQRK